ncbi:MBL fold metallo-hydrolase [Enemella dayhoffiae]|uniref:MBL fold metallo-hydrolase n=1 Tax=Enemella dayhoffiae TaxID=2016507 RepID=A0A255GYV5_9ACTN|nr:MBL fold metallo-hydrolase [Enemella dayhoffiae]OYO20855.1 MBL fold metallo-hydrolase [Enemella dayhoffiae]
MELRVIGCSGSVSGPEGPASCYLVRHDGFDLLLDLGPGGFGGLWNLEPRTVDAIALSHLHPDHCLDLCAFNVAATFSPTAPWPRIPVYAPGNAPERMSRAYEPSTGSGSDETDWWCDFRPWAAEQRIGPFTVRTIPARHSTEAYSIRLEAGGRSLVYTGDTGPNPELIELARGADLLLAEAAFQHADDLPADVHLSARQAAEHARAAGADTLVLTHIPPWYSREEAYAEARPHFDGSLELARTGAVLSVGEH